MQKILVVLCQSTVSIMSVINTTQQSIIHSFGSLQFGYLLIKFLRLQLQFIQVQSFLPLKT